VNDPEFIEQLFAGPGKTREKGQFTINGLGSSPTALSTKEHNLHKSRRAALNPFFSTKNIRRLEPMVHEIVDQIFLVLEQHRKDETPVNMSLLYRAATHDLIAEYALGHGLVCFSRPDLNQPYFDSYHEVVSNWYMGCYFPWIVDIIRTLPPSMVVKLMPATQFMVNMTEVSFQPASILARD
jgi:hypothetical protein